MADGNGRWQWQMVAVSSAIDHSHQPSAMTLSDHAGGDADRDSGRRYRLAHDGTGADHRAIADADAVENLRAGAEPCAVADRDARGGSRLLEHRARRIGEIVIAAD